jgi:hypothetical protein
MVVPVRELEGYENGRNVPAGTLLLPCLTQLSTEMEK